MKKKLHPDVVIGAVLLAASAFLMVHAMTKQSPEARQFPMIILVVFAILSAAVLAGGIKAMNDPEQQAAAGKSKLEEMKYPLIGFAFIVIYVIAVDLIGFIIPSLLFTAGLMWFNYARNKLALVLVPCGLVGFLYVLFTFILHTKMP